MAKTIFAALFGLTAGLLSGCGEGTAADSTTNEGRITIALQEVLRRNDEPFAIIEHAPSGNFVQFIGSIQDPLLLDLPIQALTAEEKTRAEKLIAELGGTHTDSGFHLEVGRNAQEAARLALRVFREVYQLSEDAELSVKVGS